MFLRVLAEEAGIGELHEFSDLTNRKCRILEAMCEFRDSDIRNPLAGGLTATLLAYLREVLRCNIKLRRVPLYFSLVRIKLEESCELMEGVITMIDRSTCGVIIRNGQDLIQIIEQFHRNGTRKCHEDLLSVIGLRGPELEFKQTEVCFAKILRYLIEVEDRVRFHILKFLPPSGFNAHMIEHQLLEDLCIDG